VRTLTNTQPSQGYIPDDALPRTLSFGCLILNGALLLLLRCFGAAMLIVANKNYFVAYMAGDMTLYLLQKAARNDLWYWVPVDGAMGVAMSLLMRVSIKVITDYTGVVQFRASGELGGAYWTFSMFMAIVATFVSVHIHFKSDVDEAISEEAAWAFTSVLGGAWVAVFLVFLLLTKKKYRATFFSLQTGNDYFQNYFLEAGNSDGTRAKIIQFNRHLWQSIRPQVREWLKENWPRWVEEKPEWFKLVFVSNVDDDLLPPEVLEQQKLAGGGSRRRSSLGERMGSVRRRSTAQVAPVEN